MASERRRTPSKFAFLIVQSGSKTGQINVYSLQESSHIVAYENVHFFNEKYETRGTKLADENEKC